MMKRHLFLLSAVLAIKLQAQELPADSSSSWNFSAWAELCIIPEDREYFNPTFYARHNTLHLEARYNYEDLNTASVWAGRRFKFGKKVRFVMVPLAGIVFGTTNGLAPGLEMEIMYKKFDFYAESEHVFDLGKEENNFFYMYSELAVRPVQPLRTGLITQRTRLFESERELQRGVFAEYYFKKLRTGVFYFNPFTSYQFWIASFSVDF
jgi:hypothetical protein